MKGKGLVAAPDLTEMSKKARVEDFAVSESHVERDRETPPELAEDAQHSARLASALGELLGREELCDLTIETAQGARVSAHSCVLAATSPRVRRHLQKHPVRLLKVSSLMEGAAATPLQQMALQDADTLRRVFRRYAYFGAIDVRRDRDVEELQLIHQLTCVLAVAVFLEIQGCVVLAVDLLRSLLSIATSPLILHAAIDLQCLELQAQVEAFIDANFSNVVLEQSWIDAPGIVIQHVLARDSIVTTDGEMECFRAIARWGLEDLDARTATVKSLLLDPVCSRFHWMSPEEMEDVLYHEIVESLGEDFIQSIKQAAEKKGGEDGKKSPTESNNNTYLPPRRQQKNGSLPYLTVTSSSSSSSTVVSNYEELAPTQEQRPRGGSLVLSSSATNGTKDSANGRVPDTKLFGNVRVLSGHEKPVCALAANTEWVASGSADCTIRIWECASSFKNTHVLRGHLDSVSALKFMKSYLISGSFDRSIRVWNAGGDWEKQRVVSEVAHDEPVTCLTVLSKTTQLASGSAGGEIKIWQPPKLVLNGSGSVKTEETWEDVMQHGHFDDQTDSEWQLLFILQNAHAHVLWNCCEWGDLLASGSSDTEIRVWNTSDWSMRNKILFHKDEVQALIVVDNKLYSGSDDGVVAVHEGPEQDCKEVKHIRLHRAILALGAYKSFLVVGCGDGTVLLLNRSDLSEFGEVKGHSSGVMSLVTNNDQLVSGSFDQTIRVWDNH